MAEILRPEPSKTRKSFFSKTPERAMAFKILFRWPPQFPAKPIRFNASSDLTHPGGTSSCCFSKNDWRVFAHSPVNFFLLHPLLVFISGISIRLGWLGLIHSQYNHAHYTLPKQFHVAMPRLSDCALRTPSRPHWPNIQSTSPRAHQGFGQPPDPPDEDAQKRKTSEAFRHGRGWPSG